MTIEIALIFIGGAVVGGIAGYIIKSLKFRPKVGGVINIDRSDPVDGPYMFLELSESVNDLSRKEYVTFRVANTNYLSQE